MTSSLITPDQVRAKALRKWKDGSFLSYALQRYRLGETEPRLKFFPLNIPFKTPSSRFLSAHFPEVKEGINKLKTSAKAVVGRGYMMHYREIHHRTLGRQKIPEKITLDTQEDFLACIGRTTTFQDFQETTKNVLNHIPKLFDLLERKPHIVLDHVHDWKELLAVCDYFLAHPKPAIFVRQLDIPGVDTKFIERHRSILDQLLQAILPVSVWDPEIKSLSHYGFERKYGLLFPESLIRFRMLAPCEQDKPFADASIPLSNFIKLVPAVSRVFITENKVNGLAFPCVPDAMVIFGLGYGIKSLKEVTWLKAKKVYYWGDIDSHGFNILARVRKMFVQTVSIMMDRETLSRFEELTVNEPGETRFTGAIDGLTPEERKAWLGLRQTGKQDREGTILENFRLEQERIPYSWVEKTIRALL